MFLFYSVNLCLELNEILSRILKFKDKLQNFVLSLSLFLILLAYSGLHFIHNQTQSKGSMVSNEG